MTLRDFRKMLQGCDPEAELGFCFEGLGRGGDVTYLDYEPASVIEQNVVDSDRKSHPVVIIQFRKEDIDER